MSDTMVEGLKVGKQLIEGKTKIVYDLPGEPGCCLIVSKDRITCGDGARAHDLEGKAKISNDTLSKVFAFLNHSGVKSHFVRRHSDTSFVGRKCAMIPIECVTRRVATGSFLKRNPGVPEGYRFSPPKIEFFFKDDANHDPQWSYEEFVAARLEPHPGRVIDHDDVDILARSTQTIFEILERAWASLDCQLVDMKIEFGVDFETGEIILSDVIDSDSWRLWPGGDRRMMLDKQVYRDMKEVTTEGLDTVIRNFRFVADKLDKFVPPSPGKAVVLMGSPTDEAHCRKIQEACTALGVACQLRVTSAHKGTAETLNVLSEYEGLTTPVVLIAVAGRSNGLGPVLSANSCLPVINCPPLGADWGREDIWSSLRLPAGLGCATVTSPDGAAQMAANILATAGDHVIWARLRARQLQIYISLKRSDAKLRGDH
jgi:phosphoribosylaminoimidazole carboxylase/phosphoribosylaminoimidazole-succinocarboxamide synthase